MKKDKSVLPTWTSVETLIIKAPALVTINAGDSIFGEKSECGERLKIAKIERFVAGEQITVFEAE